MIDSSRRRRLTAIVLGLALGVAACSGGDERGTGDGPVTTGPEGGTSGPSGAGNGGSGGEATGVTTGTGSGTGTPSGGGDTGTTATTGTNGGGVAGTPQPKRPPGWRVIAKAPIKGRHAHSALWTGQEMIVWGGAQRAGNAPIYLEDGAAYDPATDKWRTLPASPLGPRADHVAAWTGKEMLIWGGNPGIETPFGNNEYVDGAAYDPATDTWRPMARFPLTARYATRAVWSGKVLVVWGGARAEDGEDAEPLADGAAYDPDRDSWSELPPSPLAGRLSPLAAAVDGTILISWGFNRDPGQALDGARYDPAAEAWATVAPVPSAEAAWCFDLAGCVGIDTGTRVVFAGEGLVYDQQADRWAEVATSPLADPFLDGKALAFTGNRVVVFGGGRYTSDAEAPPEDVIQGPGMAYDPGADRWTPLPPAPIAARARTRGVWTGAEFVVWGGEGSFTERVQHADGAAWTP